MGKTNAAKKKAGGGKGKAPRVDKAPPTPNSANPQQHNSALPSPERTPTALTKPISLPGSPSTPVAGLPSISASLDGEPEKPKEAPVSQAEPGVTEVQLPTPSEPDVPLPTVTEGDGAAVQTEPATDTNGHSTEPQPDDSVSVHVDALAESRQPDANSLLDTTQLASVPENEAEIAVDAGVGDDPVVGDAKPNEEPLQDLLRPTEESEKLLPAPPEDEGHENGHNAEEMPQDLLLQVSEVPAEGDQEPTGGLGDSGEQQDQGALLDWGDWAEESAGQQLDETLVDVDDFAEAPVPDVLGVPEAEHDAGSGENSTEVAPISNTEAEHVEDLIGAQSSAEAAESEQIGDLLEQPLDDRNMDVAFENHDISTVEDAGDTTGQVATNDHIVDVGVHDITQGEGDPVEGHVVDSGEMHEWDITEATDGPLEQAPIDGDPVIVDPSQVVDLDITEDADNLFEEWPAIDNTVDTSQTPALETNGADTSDLQLEDTSLAEIPTDQAADGQTTEEINPDVSIGEWKVDETPGDVESGSAQQLEGEHTLADGDGPAAEDVLTEGVFQPEESAPMEGLESTEHTPEAWAAEVVESNDVVVDAHVLPESDLAEGPPLDIPEETQPGEQEDTTELQTGDETGDPPPLSTHPGEDADKLLSEGDPNAEIASAPVEHEAEADTAFADLEGAAALQAEASQPPEESPDSSTTLPPTQSTTETEEIPPESALAPEIQEPSIAIDPAPHSEENPVEIVAETSEMADTEGRVGTQTDESTVSPPSQSMLETEQIPFEPAIVPDIHDSSINIDPEPPSGEKPVEVMIEANEMAEANEISEATEMTEVNGMAKTNEMAEINGMVETDGIAKTREDRVDTQTDETSEAPPAIQPNNTSVDAQTNGVAIVGQESSFTALTAQDVATPEIVAISEMFGTMRAALFAMTNAFDKLTVQTERMAADSLHIKAAEQLGGLKAALGHQIARQKGDVEALRLSLQAKIKHVAEEKIREHLRDVIKQSVKAQVEEKVRAQMAVQIPDELRQQVISHQRKIIQVKTDLHNSEARMFNALQTVPGARLRPLLRPLPTPEQSPVAINISRSTSMGSTTLGTPASSFPSVPAPTPIRRSVSNSMRAGGGLETIPPTPSKFFPRDLNALFALSQDEARRLLREYGLKSTTASPAVENNTPMRARGLSIVNEEGMEEDPEVHARDMNTFMAHIGVPFLMIPPPKEKPGEEMPPLSSRSRRKMLTPLIIK